MRSILLLLVAVFGCNFSYGQMDIADARSMAEGTEVTITGVVTNGGELGIIRYVQDETGGIAAYPGAGSTGDFPDDVQRGDMVEVTGVLKIYNELLEIDPISDYTVISSGNADPDPVIVSPDGIAEDVESQLLKLENISFAAGGNTFSVGNYEINAGGESSEIYIRTNHPLIGTEIPLASVNLTGIASQFNSIYQLLPRDINDIEIADNFYLTKSPNQSNISTTGFDIEWETNEAGSSIVRYGTTPAMGDEMIIPGPTTSHKVELMGLDASTFYYVEVASDNGSSEVASTQQIYSTASTSSGEMNIYFTYDVDGSYSTGTYPTGISGASIEAAIIGKINNAQNTIDAAFYNINRETIVAALTAALERGVIVRYIADNETANLALSDPSPPFPVIRGNSDGLMHNKFLIIDEADNDNAWIMSGSTNMTSQNLVNDYNNMIFIQDKSLAQAYKIEFEEMWGSEGADPGVFNVAFGPDKANNTPHTFMVNGTMIESYFSPSDNTTIAISKAIESADNDLQFALLTFTNNELGSAVVASKNNGIDVRGIIDNINDQGSEYDWLISNDVNVTPDNTTASTHHKYCIVDANGSDPRLVVGSHNWSAGAETRNDENTLIIHSPNVVNVYQQEFEARWCEVQGGSACVTNVDEAYSIEGVDMLIYPMPSSDFANISITLEDQKDLSINIFDMKGRLLQSTIRNNVAQNFSHKLDLTTFSSGSYIVQVRVGKDQMARVIEVVK